MKHGLLMSGVFVSLTALIVILGWIFHVPRLVQLNPNFVPMQFNTALCFLLSGLSFVGFVLKKRTWVLGISAVLFSISAMTLSQYFFHYDAGLDQFFIKPLITVKTSHPGRMAPNTALSFILIALLGLLNESSRQLEYREISQWFLSGLIFSLGAVAFLGYLLNLETAFGWEKYTRMAVHTSFCVMLLGGSYTWDLISKLGQTRRSVLTPFPIGIAFLLIFVLLGQALKTNEVEAIKKVTRENADILQSKISLKLHEDTTAFRRLSERMTYERDYKKSFWLQDTRDYYYDFKFYLAFFRLNAKDRIQWVYPQDYLQQPLIDLSEDFFRKSLKRARAEKNLVISPVYRAIGLRNVFLLIHPLYFNGQYIGSSVGLIDVSKFLNRVVDNIESQPFSFKILEKDRLVYKSSLEGDLEFRSEYSLRRVGFDWVVEIYPHKDSLKKITSMLPEFTIVFGIILSLLIGFLSFMLIRSNEVREKSKEHIERYNLAIEGVGVGVWDWINVDEKREYWSPKFYELIGYRPGELRANVDNFANLLHPEDKQKTFALVDKAFKGEGDFQTDYRLRHKTKGYRWFHANACVDYDYSGNPKRMVGSITDIHEAKLIELKEQLQLEVFEVSSDYMFQIDANSKITYMNKALKSFSGVEEIEQADFSRWHTEEQELKLKREILLTVLQSAYWRGEINIRDKNGAVFPCLFIATGHRGEDGIVQFITGVYRDITDIKNKALELERSNEELEQFAYAASHDLKAPLRHISSYIDVLQEELNEVKLNEDALKAMEYVQSGAKRMTSLISDLLAFSRLGTESSNFELADLNQILKDLQILFRTNIEEKEATLSMQTLPDIVCDANRVSQVFQNLIGNSLKYCAAGVRPELKISFKEKSDHWEFVFNDNGVGIPEEQKERVFKIFQRLHTAREAEGTGIGLSICKKIIEAHRGKIWINTKVSSGTEFHFTISKRLQGSKIEGEVA